MHEYDEKDSYKLKGYLDIISKPSTGGVVMIQLKKIVVSTEELSSEFEENLTVLVRINQEFFLIMMMYKISKTDKF